MEKIIRTKEIVLAEIQVAACKQGQSTYPGGVERHGQTISSLFEEGRTLGISEEELRTARGNMGIPEWMLKKKA